MLDYPIGGGIGWLIPPGSPRYNEMLCVTSILWGGNESAPLLDAFQGANPVSVMKEDLAYLSANAQDYVAAEKTDGVRFWLVAGVVDGVCMAWLCDRALRIVQINASFLPPVFDGTLLDTELVQCRPEHGGRWELMVFDAVAVCGRYVGQMKDFLKRLEGAAACLTAVACEAFTIRVKPMFPARQTGEVFASLPSHRHHTDGVILSPRTRPVCRGLDRHTFKVKPRGMHTVDLEVVPVEEAYDPEHEGAVSAVLRTASGTERGRCVVTDAVLGHGGARRLLCGEWTGCVAECKRVDAQWVPYKIRHDKTVANSEYVVERTERNCVEALWEHEIVACLTSS